VKVFLVQIINKGLIPLPDIKDYWSSDRKTHITFFGHNVQRSHLTDILDDACGEMIPSKETIRPSKNKGSTCGDRTYRETVSEKFCAK
jgi:hypothetical protein